MFRSAQDSRAAGLLLPFHQNPSPGLFEGGMRNRNGRKIKVRTIYVRPRDQGMDATSASTSDVPVCTGFESCWPPVAVPSKSIPWTV
ncbi:Hypothetical predicted protein [Podarcis lilfordi]|uniref:Uncharacterized protein n=1 Tax=Podarcis lilfordi TaxID=74358 RepID=A0AA35KE11_9SAUR|nr:Hypothetical predicted protein [Podarcis lilfordi]